MSRELDSKILLALCAAEMGLPVLLGDITQDLLVRWGAPAGLFHDHNATPTRQYMEPRRVLLNRGFVITVHDEEHGLNYLDFDQFALRRFSGESLDQVARVYCWGKHDFDGLNRLFPSHGGRFLPSGSPRADLWSQTFNPSYPVDALPSSLQRKSYILMAPSTGALGGSAGVGLYLNAWRSVEDGVDFRDFQSSALRELEDSLDHVAKFVNFVRSVRASGIDVPIVIKPHPAESPTLWRSLVGEERGVVIDEMTPTSVLVRHSRAVVQMRSTVALEARALGIPVISLESGAPNTALAWSLGLQATSIESAVKSLEAILSSAPGARGEYADDERAYLDDRLRRLEPGELASDQIAADWIGILGDRGQSHPSKSDGPRVRSWLRLVSQAQVQSRLRNPAGAVWAQRRGPSMWTHHDNRRIFFPRLSRQLVRNRINGIAKSTGRFSHVGYRHIAPRIILFFPKHSPY